MKKLDPILHIELSKDGKRFVADVPAWPGAPAVGRGNTMASALGDWLMANQREIGVTIDLDKSAEPAEARRVKRELRKR